MLKYLYYCCCMFSCCRRIGQEFKALTLLASYGFLYHLLDRSFWLANLIFIGQQGKGTLSAAAISLTALQFYLLFLEGFLHSVDVLGASSKDTNQHKLLYTAIVCNTIIAILFTILILVVCPYLFVGIGLKSSIYVRSLYFLYLLIPSVWVHGVFLIAHKYMRMRSNSVPSLLAIFLGILANATLSALLMFQIPLGLLGAAVGIFTGQVVKTGVLLWYMRREGDSSSMLREGLAYFQGLWRQVRALLRIRSNSHYAAAKKRDLAGNRVTRHPSESSTHLSEERHAEEDSAEDGEDVEMIDIRRSHEDIDIDVDVEVDVEVEVEDTRPLISTTNTKSSLCTAELRRMCATGLSCACMSLAYTCPARVHTLLCASLGPVAICTHFLAAEVALLFVCAGAHPLGSALTLRIRHLLHTRQSPGTSTRLAVWLIVLFAVPAGGLVYIAGKYWAAMFTTHSSIIGRVAGLGSVWGAGCVVVKGVLVGVVGGLRGVDRQYEVFLTLLVSQWLIAPLLSYALAYRTPHTYDLLGIYIGEGVGLALTLFWLYMQLSCLDWKYELKRHIAIHEVSSSDGNRSSGTTCTSVVSPSSDCVAIGGVGIRVYRDLEEEIREMMRIEDVEEDFQEVLV